MDRAMRVPQLLVAPLARLLIKIAILVVIGPNSKAENRRPRPIFDKKD